MKKTKIICSIGPSSSNYETMKAMILNGMNVARINFSHSTREESEEAISLVTKLNKDLNTHVGILFDTKGPDFRTGLVENGELELVDNEIIKIVKDDVVGNKERITVNYKDALDFIKIGDDVLLEDGLMRLNVISKDDEGLTCKIVVGGILGNRKGINVPGTDLNLEFISKTDKEDIMYAIEQGGDFLALSFVNSKEDIMAVREILKEHNSDMQIISKIESRSSVTNIDEIIKASDAIMVARGDLGVEISMARLPILQKDIIEKCRKRGRTCIVATEMLASMYTSSRPTRAEISDVANAVLDGTDAVMLSGETTVGKYPDLAVKFMAEACESAENYYNYANQGFYTKENSIPSTIAQNVVDSANHLEVKVVVAATTSGYTAKLISTLKPKSFILATCMSDKVARSLALNYAVYPVMVDAYNSMEEIVECGKEKAMDFMDLKSGDIIIITGGFPRFQTKKTTNFLKIEQI